MSPQPDLSPPAPALVARSRVDDARIGALAGLVAGIAVAIGMLTQRTMAPGLVPLPASGAGIAAQLLLAAGLGTAFGAVFRFQPRASAAAVSGGLLMALAWWVVGPLTAVPFINGTPPRWSLAEATAAFPNLIATLIYGGLTGLVFQLLGPFHLRLRPGRAGRRRPNRPQRRVIILGGGFAGVSAAEHLEHLSLHDADVEIVLVSPSNYLLFTPMLAEVASSALQAQHISVPVRASCPRTRFHRAEVEAVDLSAQQVRFRESPSAPATVLDYDHLVLALGSVPNFLGLPGLAANSFTLKTLQDATRLRNHVLATLERADVELDADERRRQLTFTVAGGGFAGTEMIAELLDLVHDVRRYYPNVPQGECRFVLIHGRDAILPEIGGALADYALATLRARGIEFRLGTRVSGATPDAVLLAGQDPIGTRTLVWTAGNQPHPLLRTLACERNRAGAVVTEPTLQVKGYRNVWAVGDCAEIPHPDDGKPYPPTAQHALREGRHVAANVAAVLRRRPPTAFRFRSLGVLVALGHRSAVAEIRGWRFSGLLAWLLWRSIYLAKLPGLEKKLRVLFDWTLDLAFPRDIVLTSSATPTLTDVVTPSTVEDAR